MSKIAEEIAVFKEKIKVAEATDFIYLTPPVQQLRHDVLYIHTSLEASVDKIISHYTVESANLGKQAVREKIELLHRTRMLLNEIDFSKKLKITETQKLLPKNVISKLFAVNQIRVYFAHPTSYRPKLLLYQQEERLLSAYKVLSDALDALKKAGIEDRPIVLYTPEDLRLLSNLSPSPDSGL